MNLNLTLLGQSISFAIFVWFCMKYVWPPVIQALNERRERIAQGLADAERARQELAQAQESSQSSLEEARTRASALIAQANQRAEQIKDQARQEAQAETGRLLAAAQANIEQQTSRAREELCQELATLVGTGVEKVLTRSVDMDAHQDLIEELTEQLRAGGGTS